MAKRSTKLRRKYPLYFRFLNSIIVLSATVIIIGSFGAGARIITIVLRSGIIICTLYLGGNIIIKAWQAYEELRNSNNGF